MLPCFRRCCRFSNFPTAGFGEGEPKGRETKRKKKRRRGKEKKRKEEAQAERERGGGSRRDGNEWKNEAKRKFSSASSS